ncbi:hypothetical protein BD779DRAFT_62931 [Infundibulicybe gibba]|nr:hypothetical protein BD779DRAFT_62931 [Infundibulicybe gibba]
MATLEIIYDAYNVYDLWSWSMGNIHRTCWIHKAIRRRVFIARLGPRGEKPTQVIIVKNARGAEELEELTHESERYEKELKHLQGTIVPRCFGFYRGKALGVDHGCLLLEYCTGPPIISMFNFNQKLLRAAYKMHRAGIIHGDLLDSRHCLKMGNEVRIIDFSLAVRHRCKLERTSQTSEDGTSESSVNCPEMELLEKTYGAMSERSDPRSKHTYFFPSRSYIDDR